MVINQWLPAAHRGDAVGDSARQVRELLRSRGHDSELYAMTIDDDLRSEVRRFSHPKAQQGDVTILHFAIASPMSDALAALPAGSFSITTSPLLISSLASTPASLHLWLVDVMN